MIFILPFCFILYELTSAKNEEMYVVSRAFRQFLKVKFDCVLFESKHTFSVCTKVINIPLKMSSDNQESSQPIISILPPPEVRGMKALNREAFSKEINVPYILVPVEKIKEAIKFLKPCLLKMPNLQPVQEDGKEKKILLHPDLFDEKLLYLQKILNKLNLSGVLWTNINLNYDNWTTDHIFKAVLPTDSTGNVSSFSIVGHIIHINLKPDLMDFKHLIGQVLLDKHSNIETVVNKAHIIENEFRNFNIELLAGEPKYEVLVKENNCQYTFDFSKVFWNPRLGHEHNEIVKRTNPHDLVYDVFAGVGPFAVPLAKKKCDVHANDLNPDSFKWLCHNSKLNKVSQNLHCYNLDGKEFIQTVVKKGLTDFWNSDSNDHCFHVLMNLPALALDFLESFEGLFADDNLENIGDMPIVYCYFFHKKDESISDILGKYFDDETQKTLEITSVRLVAPNKMMMRVTYKIPSKILFLKSTEPPAKKSKLDNESNETNKV